METWSDSITHAGTIVTTIAYTIVGTVIGGIILAAVFALWRKGVVPRVRGWWQWLQRHRRERAIRQLKKAVAKNLRSENVPWFIDCRRYETALGESRREKLDLFSNFQLDTRITPSDYKIARALESLAEERTLHKIKQEPFGMYAPMYRRYAFTYHSGNLDSYDAEQQLLESEAACMEYNSNTQGFSDACPDPRYELYNASNEPNKLRLAFKKREDGPEHCGRCWEMRDQALKAATE